MTKGLHVDGNISETSFLTQIDEVVKKVESPGIEQLRFSDADSICFPVDVSSRWAGERE
jgi:hypothetical protein